MSAHQHSPDFWLGKLSLIMAASAKRLPQDGKTAGELLRRELRAFERSPVISEPLKQMLREEMRP